MGVVVWVLAIVVIVVVVVAFPAVMITDVVRRSRLGVLETCSVDAVPTSFGAGVADFVQQHFLVAGALRVVNPKAPEAWVVLFANPSLGAYGRLWVTGTARADAAVSSPLDPGSLVTATRLPTSILPDELQQMFPNASIAELCERHAEALAFLDGRGVTREPVTVDGAEADFRTTWARDLDATRHAGPKVIIEASTRMLLKRPRFIGPLASQRDIDARLPRPSGA
jgi:hypothetical protein